MKVKSKALLLIAVFIVAANTNPSPEEHATAIAKGMKSLNLEPNSYFIGNCELYDYWVFSFTLYLGKPISFGLLTNIHICYSYLDRCFKDFQVRHSILPNQGRGTPDYTIFPQSN